MKILLTGSGGTLSRHISQMFHDQNIHEFSHNDLDITDLVDITRVLNELRPDIIINTASYNDVEEAETKEGLEKANLINGLAVGNLAKIANQLKCVIVHFSTDYIFDGTKVEGYVETDKPHPINNYGRSKLLGEVLLQKNTDKFYIIRMSRLFGNPGTAIDSKRSFVDSMLNLAKTKKIIDVLDEEISSPTYASDASNIVRTMLLNKLPFGIYHITNSGNCTWYQFATRIFSIYTKNHPNFISPEVRQVSSDQFKRKAKRPKFSILINTKLPKLRTWDVALEDYLKTQQ